MAKTKRLTQGRAGRKVSSVPSDTRGEAMADRNQIMGLVLEHLKDSSQPIDISQVVDALKGEAPEEAIRGAILKLIDTQQLLIDENMQLLNSHVLVK